MLSRWRSRRLSWAVPCIGIRIHCRALEGDPGAFSMADNAVPYPPVPRNVPPDLTTPSISYRLRVIVVLTSLFLFAFLYLGLVAGTAYLCYRSFAPQHSTESMYLAGMNLLNDASRTGNRLTKA